MASKIRERIITHAIRCFAAHGYAGCSTKEIAERADVTEGSVFRLCLAKEKLFAEVLARCLASKKMGITHLRVIAFAMLEDKGLNEANRKVLSRVAAKSQVLRELRSISK